MEQSKIFLNYIKHYSPKFEQFAINFHASLVFFYENDNKFSKIMIPGDDSNIFPPLSMTDYFVHLSWLRGVDMKKRKTLVKLETETSNRKIGSSQIDFSLLSTSYTSEILINNFSKLIVLGNPGVGKSTFARWICNQWAVSKIKVDKVPVFIELKNCDFDTKENSILNYIEKYYITEEFKQLEKFIRITAQNMMFIFDGFDEISSESKIEFRKDLSYLQSFSPKFSYMILGRPYAFFEQIFHEEEIVQIDGFNEAGINNYLKAFFENNKQVHKSANELQNDIINKNGILVDYAHNPLILSYIVLIYISEDNSKEILLGVQSMYQLYIEVYQWLIDYALRYKESNAIEGLKVLEKTYELAEFCSLNKKFTYHSEHISDKFFDYANRLSNAGFGSFISSGKGAKWTFSFSSVTIQEYFTAGKISKYITSEQFIYLSKDSFFWNINRLIIGSLTHKKRYTLVFDIFKKLDCEEYILDKTKYKYYKYTLLSECDQVCINQLIEEKHISELITFYTESYFDDYYNHLITESIQKIFPKLDAKKKYYFKQCLKSILKSLLFVDNQKREGTVKAYVIWELSGITKMTNDEEFINSLFAVQEKLMDNLILLMKDSQNYDLDEQEDESFRAAERFNKEEQELNQAIFFLLNTLNLCPIYILNKYKGPLSDLFNKAPINLKMDFSYLLAKIQSTDEIISELHKNYNEVKNLKILDCNVESYPQRLKIKLPENVKIIDYPDQILNLVYNLVKYFTKNHQILPEHALLINNCIKIYDEKFLAPEFDDRGEIIQRITDDLLVSFAKLQGDEEVLELLYHFTSIADLQDTLYGFTDKEIFKKKIQDLKKDSFAEPSMEVISFLGFLIKHTEIGRYSLGYIKDFYREIAKLFIHKEIKSLNSDKWEKNEEIAAVLYELLESPYFEFDRKISIDLALDYKDWPFFKDYAIPGLMEQQTVLYETKYIDFLSGYFSLTGGATQLVYFLENDGLFKYESNIPFLANALEFIYSEIPSDKSILKDNSYFLLSICSHFLILVKRSNHFHVDNFCELCAAYLEKDGIRAIFKEPAYYETLTAEDVLAYIILFSSTHNENHIHAFDYPYFKQEQRSESQKVKELLAQLYIPNFEVEEFHQNSYLEKAMGEELFTDFSEYVLNFHIKVNTFKYNEYLSLGIKNTNKQHKKEITGIAYKIKKLQKALLSAFRTPYELEQMIYFSLGINAHEIIKDGNLTEKTFELIKWTISENKIRELIIGAKKENQGNPLLSSIDEKEYDFSTNEIETFENNNSSSIQIAEKIYNINKIEGGAKFE